jgi:hypothetical protein
MTTYISPLVMSSLFGMSQTNLVLFGPYSKSFEHLEECLPPLRCYYFHSPDHYVLPLAALDAAYRKRMLLSAAAATSTMKMVEEPSVASTSVFINENRPLLQPFQLPERSLLLPEDHIDDQLASICDTASSNSRPGSGRTTTSRKTSATTTERSTTTSARKKKNSSASRQLGSGLRASASSDPAQQDPT